MTNCSQCGTQLPEGAAFCASCGAVVPAAAEHDDHGHGHDDHGHDHDDHGHDHGPGGHAHSAPAGPALGGMLNDWQSSASRPSVAGASSVMTEIKGSAVGGRPVPQLAMVLAGLAALIALLFGISAIKALVNAFRGARYISGGTFTIAGVLLALVGLAIAALWAAIAWLARGGSRVTVPLVYVVGAASALGGLTTGTFSNGLHALDLIGGLAAFGAIALLFVPEVRGYLDGGPATGRPASLIAAEAVLLWFGVTAVLLGLAYLLIGIAFSDIPYASASKLYVVAIGMILAAGVCLVFAHAIGRGDVKARLIISGTAAVFFLLMAVEGNLGGSWFQVVLLIGVAALLWVAGDARAAFGDAPLNLNTGSGSGTGTGTRPSVPDTQPRQESNQPPTQ